MSLCVHCRSVVRPRQQALECDACKRWQHRLCDSNVSEARYRDACAVGRLRWLCSECDGRAANPAPVAAAAIAAPVAAAANPAPVAAAAIAAPVAAAANPAPVAAAAIAAPVAVGSKMYSDVFRYIQVY